MSARFVMMAAAALAMSGNAAAEPPKAPAQEAAQPPSRPAGVLIASADQVRAPAPTPDQPNAAPVKRPRAARVTACRCGDQLEEQR